METQGQALFYAEQTVAWLASEVKLNAAVTFYFALPQAACYLHHLFPSLLLSWFRAPSSWEHWSLQLGDCAAGSGTLIFEPVTAPPSLQTQFIPLGSQISHWRDSYCLHKVFSHFPMWFSWCLAALLLYSYLSCFASQTGFESGLSNLVKCSKCVSSAFLFLTYCILLLSDSVRGGSLLWAHWEPMSISGKACS